MAAELEKLARQFSASGDEDIAQGVLSLATAAKSRGRETFSTSPTLPEGAIPLPDLTIGGKDKKQLEKALASGKIIVGDWAKDMLRSEGFTTFPDQQTISLVRAKLSDLGLTGFSTMTEILARANTFNLEKCPVEAAVYQRLADKDQPLNTSYFMAMDPIAGSDGHPRVFKLVRDADGLWLCGSWAGPDGQWHPGSEFVFSLRK